MSSSHIDWSQLLYPGRKRAFTAQEMARAGSDGPNATLIAAVCIYIALVFFMALQVAPPALTALVTGLLVLLVAMGYGACRWLWWRPWRRPLMNVTILLSLGLLPVALALRWRLPERGERLALHWMMTLGVFLLLLLLWFLVTWRAQQIESRLVEQAERERAIEMARRLAAAQIEPHFLFNTLASVQHWVQTQDARAAPLLEALTGYLRATLPLFKRTLLPAGDELVAVQRYLEVMQARLGERLRWRLDVPPPLALALLPPGLLLTLVENAIVHGIEPRLAGGELLIRATLQEGQACFEVIDDGTGPPPDMRDGVGLANVRERLALTSGSTAHLQVDAAPGGGCRAAFTLPYRTEAGA